MTRKEYTGKRAGALRIFGIVMLLLGLFTGIFGGVTTKLEHDHSTAVTVGKVVGIKHTTNDNGKTIRKAQISYTLPDGSWLVLVESDLEVGDEVNVYYNPDDPSEKYIEGYEDSPLYYVGLGLWGVVLGAGAIAVSVLSKKHSAVNDALDLVGKPHR